MNEQNKGLNSEIEQISDEAANEFEEALKNINDWVEHESKYIFNIKDICYQFVLNALKEILIIESKRYTKYCCNFVSATFITRWYWKRKMNKQSIIIKETMKSIQEVKNIYEKETNIKWTN